MTLTGKTALVTGAARGIGLAIATRLAADGAQVALLDQDADAVETAARGVGRGALALAGDVTRAKDVDGAVARVGSAWGRRRKIQTVGWALLDPTVEDSEGMSTHAMT